MKEFCCVICKVLVYIACCALSIVVDNVVVDNVFTTINPQARSQYRFFVGEGVRNPQKVNFRTQKVLFWTSPSYPLTNIPFLAHFVVKSGPFGRFFGVSHPLASGLLTLVLPGVVAIPPFFLPLLNALPLLFLPPWSGPGTLFSHPFRSL